jgi:anti-anti-sigma factor
VSGEIDLANVDQFKAFLADAVKDDNGPLIVVLEKVEYLDSHTLEALVDMSKRLSTNRRRLLVVASAVSPAGRILRTAGIDLAVAIFETQDDAMQNVQKP